ncbi:MAG: ABC-type nitrate/sulfonate/bicarbonate transport system substrate-binding protein [Maribacter sp.]|jgi:ABC-type nitrate/sulfonate/bicarbonate transport system substrate-binding protein
MEKFTIALDWTANTNHTGFYVAKTKGFYAELGLEVRIDTPDMDNYSRTPAKKVELGQADMALCPFESVISYRTKTKAFDAVAIATIFQEDLSAIASLASSGIQRPSDLDGKVYASYKARYEDEIVRQMITNNGGSGDFKIVYPEKLGIWETILKSTSDATWIFRNWEGIQAENEGIDLNLFKMADYGIPYGFSPIVLASEKEVTERKDAYTRFLEATKKGYLFAQENPAEAVKCFAPFVAKQDQNIDLVQSQKFSSPFYGTAENWGILKKQKVAQYLDWLLDNKLEEQPFTVKDLVFFGLL